MSNIERDDILETLAKALCSLRGHRPTFDGPTDYDKAYRIAKLFLAVIESVEERLNDRIDEMDSRTPPPFSAFDTVVRAVPNPAPESYLDRIEDAINTAPISAAPSPVGEPLQLPYPPTSVRVWAHWRSSEGNEPIPDGAASEMQVARWLCHVCEDAADDAFIPAMGMAASQPSPEKRGGTPSDLLAPHDEAVQLIKDMRTLAAQAVDPKYGHNPIAILNVLKAKADYFLAEHDVSKG